MKTILLSLSTLFFLFCLTPDLKAQHPCLIAHYPLDGDFLDATTSGFDGVNMGTTWVPDRNGNTNSAVDFDGISAHIVLNDHDPIIEGPYFTIMGWLNIQGPGGGTHNHNPLFIQRNGGLASSPGVNIRTWPELASGGSRFTFRGDSGLTVDRVSGSVIPRSEWHHVTFVAGPAGLVAGGEAVQLQIYVDCILVGSDPTTVNHRLNLDVGIDYTMLGLNRDPAAIEAALDGIMDDVRIFNCALTASEICGEMNDTGSMMSSIHTLKRNEVSFYPVPTQGKLFSTESANLRDFQIFSADGRLVQAAQYLEEIDLTTFSQGVYQIRYNHLGEIATQTFLVQR